MRILIADDDADLRGMLERECRERGFTEVYEASDGIEAFALFQKHAVDVVLTDFLMPNMNGMGLLHAIKALRPEMPVYILTGFGGDAEWIFPEANGTFTKLEIGHALQVVVERTRAIVQATIEADLVACASKS
jgi:DNA-binding NtrC family response regulator